MQPKKESKMLYTITIIVFAIITVFGTYIHFWRGEDLKFILLFFIIIVMAIRIDEMYEQLAASKTSASDMYLKDKRLQSIILALEAMDQKLDKVMVLQEEIHRVYTESIPDELPESYKAIISHLTESQEKTES